MASDGPSPHPPSPECVLALPPTSHRDATTPSPCWAPYFVTQERPMLSIPPRASRASLLPRRRETTCCRLPLCHCTAPLLISLQPLLKLPLLSLGPSQLQFVSTVSLLLNHGKPELEPMCVFLSFNLVLRISCWIRKKIGRARYFGRVATVLVLTTWYIAFCDPSFRICQIFSRCECQIWRCYHLLPPVAAPFGFLRGSPSYEGPFMPQPEIPKSYNVIS